MGINNMGVTYIVAAFEVHSDAVEYASNWKIPSWYITEAQLF